MTNPIAEGFHSITPYLVVDGCAKALDWYAENLGAQEQMRLDAPDGSIGHAEMRIGDSVVMLADANEQVKAYAPGHYGGSPVSLMFYTEGVDEVFARALANGGSELDAVSDKFYGDRSGTLRDPFGHVWTIATHVEDVSEEEIGRRLAAMAEEG